MTGKSLTTAVTAALEQRLEQEHHRQSEKRPAQEILKYAERLAAGMKPGSDSSRHADLYGEDGMPA